MAFKITCQPRPVRSLIVNRLLDNYKQSFQSNRIQSEKCFAKIIPPLLPIIKSEKNIRLILNYKLMWYKYFNKESFKLRLWRTYNLNFNYNSAPQAPRLNRTKLFQTFHKVCGHRQILQVYALMSIVSMFGMYSYYKESRYGEEKRRKQREESKKDKIRQKELYEAFNRNRVGIATNPGESLEVFSKFLENEYAIDQLSLFNENQTTQKISQDVIKGLDGPLNTEDYKLMDYIRYYSKKH